MWVQMATDIALGLPTREKLAHSILNYKYPDDIIMSINIFFSI